jgi:hypothetical protein
MAARDEEVIRQRRRRGTLLRARDDNAEVVRQRCCRCEPRSAQAVHVRSTSIDRRAAQDPRERDALADLSEQQDRPVTMTAAQTVIAVALVLGAASALAGLVLQQRRVLERRRAGVTDRLRSTLLEGVLVAVGGVLIVGALAAARVAYP